MADALLLYFSFILPFMKIGLISDTHGHLDPKVFTYFKDCDEVWHAGDIGNQALIDELKSFKKLRAVFGNIDGSNLRLEFTEDLFFELEGKKILITHIGGTPPKYNPRARKLIKEHSPDIFICGHSHILRVMHDPTQNLLYINPGAAGNHGFHKFRTLVRFDLDAGTLSNMQVIELGKRGV
jgi:uncharacterized protein